MVKPAARFRGGETVTKRFKIFIHPKHLVGLSVDFRSLDLGIAHSQVSTSASSAETSRAEPPPRRRGAALGPRMASTASSRCVAHPQLEEGLSQLVCATVPACLQRERGRPKTVISLFVSLSAHAVGTRRQPPQPSSWRAALECPSLAGYQRDASGARPSHPPHF